VQNPAGRTYPAGPRPGRRCCRADGRAARQQLMRLREAPCPQAPSIRIDAVMLCAVAPVRLSRTYSRQFVQRCDRHGRRVAVLSMDNIVAVLLARMLFCMLTGPVTRMHIQAAPAFERIAWMVN